MKISVRITDEQKAFLNQNGKSEAQVIRDAINQSMKLKKYWVTLDRRNSYGSFKQQFRAKDVRDLLTQLGEVRNQLQNSEIVPGSQWYVYLIEER